MVKLKKRLVPSIIARNQKELEERIAKVSSAKILQLDIMDGRFVSHSSLDFNFRLPKGHYYETHLMIRDPEKWIKRNHRKAGTIIVHFESLKDHEKMNKVMRFLKSKKKRIGLAIRPETDIEKIIGYLDFVDEVLVMAVHPGKYGARFLPKTMRKVMQLRKLEPRLDIEVDGGITPKTIKKAKEAGANIFICGSYIMESDQPKKTIKIMERLI